MKLKLLSPLLAITSFSFAQAEHAQQRKKFEFEGCLYSDFQWNYDDKVNWVNYLGLSLSLSPWENGHFDLSTVSTVKTREDRIIDDYQWFSNIEVDNMFCGIGVLGYMHEWEHFDLFFGVRTVNEDYFVSPLTLLFMNSSPGIFPTVWTPYPIANYPVASLGLHFNIKLDKWTISNSFYNGIGHNGWTHDDNPFIFRPKKEGVFDAFQLAYNNENSGTRAFAGGCIHNRQFDSEWEMIGKKTTGAWWLYLEQQVCANDKNSLSVMVQYSENTSKDNECYRYAEIGFIGGFSTRSRLGLSYQFAQFQETDEHLLELTFRTKINDLLTLQPTAMYIHNTEADYGVLSMRLILSF